VAFNGTTVIDVNDTVLTSGAVALAESVAAFLVGRSELFYKLRSSTPFAGALTPQERWKIWRETREKFSQQS
jgi:hypothetical protein